MVWSTLEGSGSFYRTSSIIREQTDLEPTDRQHKNLGWLASVSWWSVCSWLVAAVSCGPVFTPLEEVGESSHKWPLLMDTF